MEKPILLYQTPKTPEHQTGNRKRIFNSKEKPKQKEVLTDADKKFLDLLSEIFIKNLLSE